MKKLSSKLFENFKKNEIDQTSLIVGGMTAQKDDCNTSSYEDDHDTTWRQDSKDNTDSIRADDGCNAAPVLPSLP